MTIPTAPALTNPGAPPTRSDPATFAARGDAFLSWFPTAWTNLVDSMTWIRARVQEVFDSANAAQSDRIAAQAAAAAVAAQSPVTNAAAAAAAATAAAASAAIAQAVSPDSPIRMNTRSITANLAIPSAYNAASVGPISIAPGITVTVQDNATWAIN